jgi:hypothetical protein
MNRMEFRLPGGVKRDPDVEVWLNAQTPDLGSLAREWFDVIRESGDDVRELMHDGCPVACVGDAPFAYVNAFTSHVNVGFFHGATLADPGRLLEGSGKYMRHVKLKPREVRDSARLCTLIEEAYWDLKRRLDVVSDSARAANRSDP